MKVAGEKIPGLNHIKRNEKSCTKVAQAKIIKL